MFGLSSIQYGSFSVRAKFRSIISGVSSGRNSVRSVWVRSLLPDLLTVTLALGAKENTTIPICARCVVTPSKKNPHRKLTQSLFMKYKKKTGASR